jgi:hypothetical protein
MSEMGGVPEVAGLRQDCVGVAISLQESAALADVYKVEKMHLLGAFIVWTSASRLLFRCGTVHCRSASMAGEVSETGHF